MKSNQLVAVLVLMSTLSAYAMAGKSAEDHSKDKAFIRGAINKMDIAYAAEDSEGYVAYTAPDFVSVNLTGKETTHGKEERRQKVNTTFAKATDAGVKITSYSTARSISFSGEGATVIEDSYVSYSGNVDGQARVLKDHNTCRDFWVKSSAGWLEKKSRTIFDKVTLNGQSAP